MSNPRCSKCGIAGIHACSGQPIPPWTEQQLAELDAALVELFRMEPESGQGVGV
jgi:hypothetical protein